MKVLNLTEEHKTKLLEMCKVLFSEYKYLIFGDYPGDMIFNKTVTFDSEQWLDMDEDEILSIHWFEFCMTHLAEKIIATFIVNKDDDKVYKRTLNDDLSKFYLESLLFSRGFDKTHPVDYLYKHFKELKLNNK